MQSRISSWGRRVVLVLTVGVACASPSGGASSRGDPVESVSVESQTATQNITLRPDVSASRSSIEAPAKKVWAALPTAYSALPIPLEAIDSAHHFVVGSALAYREFLRSPVSQFVDCGSTIMGPSADSYNVRLRVQTQVDSVSASSSALRTWVEATGSSSGGAVRCSSTGRLERMIGDQVKALLGVQG
jgi:hypothetical protein